MTADSSAAVAGGEMESGADPDLVPRARRLIRSVIEPAHPDLINDAELVVSELVTNATLHGEAPFTIRVRAGAQVRIEVEDGGQHLPVLRPARLDATTGRGLSLVASVSARWGIEDLPGPGKRVWAELDPGGRRPGLPATPPDPLLSRREGDLQRLHVVCLGPVPTDLLIEAEAHIDGVVRELSLLEEGVAAGGAPLPPELAELVEPLTVDFADGRRQIVDQAAAAAARGEVRRP